MIEQPALLEANEIFQFMVDGKQDYLIELTDTHGDTVHAKYSELLQVISHIQDLDFPPKFHIPQF